MDQIIGASRGGGGGGGGAVYRGAMHEESEMFGVESMAMSSAPRKKAKATNKIGGQKKLNDAVSTKLYKLSKKC